MFKWKKLFSKYGYPEDEFELGLIYYEGEKTTKNYKAAVKWFRKSAEKGHTEAQYYLGACYQKFKDYKAAVKWFRKSAEQGHTEAQLNLGRLYLDGTGVQKSLGEAYIWFSLYAINEHPYSSAGNFLDKLESSMTQEQIADAQQKAKDLFEKYPKIKSFI